MQATITRIGIEVKRPLGYIEATRYFVYPQWITESSCLERSTRKGLLKPGFREW